MSDAHAPLSFRSRLVIGLGMIAFGLLPVLATFDIGPLGAEDINGPAWLGAAAGGTFIAGGLALIAGPGRPLLNGVLGLAAVGGLAAIGNWIAFGAGERVCGASILFWVGEAEGLGCRIPFGIGAVITNAILLAFAVIILQTACGGPPRLARLRRYAEGLLLLSLAPILVPLFLVLMGRAGFGALWTRMRTGQWPRNEEFIARQRARRNRGKSGSE